MRRRRRTTRAHGATRRFTVAPGAVGVGVTAKWRRRVPSTTEITIITGKLYHVEGDVKEVERTILDAARGSIMELAWLVEAETGQAIGVNPEHVVTMRAIGP